MNNATVTVCNDEAGLRKHLADNPDDWTVRSFLADLLEEFGRADECQCQRWMVENRKRPYTGSDRKSCTWFNADTISEGLGDPASDLPADVYDRLKLGKVCANHRIYGTIEDAEGDLMQALKETI